MRILIVEDEPKLTRVLCRGLQQEGYAVDTAADGRDGLHMAVENPYDAVVLDIMLPVIDGFEVCRTMRARNSWAPVLMLTARDEVSDRVRGLDAGADDYLAKPFAFDELLARLRSLTRRGVAERPAIAEVGPLWLDPARHRVEHSGTPIELSPKEFALLEFFLRHPGEVLTRTRILEHVWDYSYDGGSNVVDVYVRYLRSKLPEPNDASLIRTIRGVGYMLQGRTPE